VREENSSSGRKITLFITELTGASVDQFHLCYPFAK
jgi:hypothetical protein